MIVCTTGTSIETYFDWLKKELKDKQWGEISISFIVNNNQVVDVKKTSMDHEHFVMKKI
jgi:hypothetical protein